MHVQPELRGRITAHAAKCAEHTREPITFDESYASETALRLTLALTGHTDRSARALRLGLLQLLERCKISLLCAPGG